jgi:hypothetical protein
VGYRIQGVLLRQKPDEDALPEAGNGAGYKLFELTGLELWLLDLNLPALKPGDRASIRAARPLAPSYVDVLRVLGSDDQIFEQAPWLTATAGVARLLGQPAFGFLSDDDRLDFAAIATPEGVSVIGDTIEPFLIRWEAGDLVIQPYCKSDPDAEMPRAPEELSLIPSATVLETERLTDGYPLHGNVVAEIGGFAPGVEVLGIGTLGVGPIGSLRLVGRERMEHSVWDRAVGGHHERSPWPGATRASLSTSTAAAAAATEAQTATEVPAAPPASAPKPPAAGR